ncbi:primase-helicase family protein [Loktanella salsilacus]|uniref:primase-helicase family protein n=1 Tax=Loktanella salsilacus TaxID=195913 RepID=UPI0020B8F967|nr:primase-helicase family protein [Loktanella salsilacus]UTH44940.1 hypothetical protein KBK07_02265 [Loktanella salsilacus]
MKNTTNEPNQYTEETIATICRSIAQWFVRKDNKFYDVTRPHVTLSRNDVERIALSRMRPLVSPTGLTNQLVRAVFRRAIDDLTTLDDQSIAVWNGEISCRPGHRGRLVRNDGAVSINLWQRPEYRDLRINEADYGLAGEFFATILPRQAERDMFLNWVAWCLQNEASKPTWGPLLYSRTMGTGKSTVCTLLTELFGDRNSVIQNNIDTLTSRFNMTVLQSKLVVSEELQVKPGSKAANMLKSYMTETTTLSEMKGREAERVRQSCCFVFTTNHLPTWLDGDNRRFYVIDVDHDGHASGPRAAEFVDLVGRLHAFMADPTNLARLYNALMARTLPSDFSATTLNTALHSTEIMRRLASASEQTVVAMLDEELTSRGTNAIPESSITRFVAQTLRSPMSQTRHLMADLGWSKVKVKWDGVDYTRSVWVRPKFCIERGYICGPGTDPVKLGDHLAAVLPPEGREFSFNG